MRVPPLHNLCNRSAEQPCKIECREGELIPRLWTVNAPFGARVRVDDEFTMPKHNVAVRSCS